MNSVDITFIKNMVEFRFDYALEVRWSGILNGLDAYYDKYGNDIDILIEYTNCYHNKKLNELSITQNNKTIKIQYGFELKTWDKEFDNLIYNYINQYIIEYNRGGIEKMKKCNDNISREYNLEMCPVREKKIFSLPIYHHLKNATYDVEKYRNKTLLCTNVDKNKRIFKYTQIAIDIGVRFPLEYSSVPNEILENINNDIKYDYNGFYKPMNEYLINYFIEKCKRINLYKSDTTEDCPICFELTDLTTFCKHTLCKSCCFKLTRPICPICRRNLTAKRKENFNNETKEIEPYDRIDNESKQNENNDSDNEEPEHTIAVNQIVIDGIAYLVDEDNIVYDSGGVHDVLGRYINGSIVPNE